MTFCSTCGALKHHCFCEPVKQANESASGSSNASPCSGAGWKAPADDPSVQGTGLPGFAELRARALQEKKEADERIDEFDAWGKRDCPDRSVTLGEWAAFDRVLQWLDELEADAKDETR